MLPRQTSSLFTLCSSRVRLLNRNRNPITLTLRRRLSSHYTLRSVPAANRVLLITSTAAACFALSAGAYGHLEAAPEDPVAAAEVEDECAAGDGEEEEDVAHGGLHPDRFESLRVMCNKPLSRVHMLLRLELDSAEAKLNYPLGGVVQVRALTKTIDEVFPFGKFVSGYYVPVSFQSKKGHFDLIYKVHDVEAEGNLLKPEHGMSQHLASLRTGDRLEVRGPFRVIEQFPPKNVENKRLHYGLIAGGTGLTPMIQVVRNLLEDNDDAAFTLIVSCKTDYEIFYERELKKMAKKYKGRFTLVRMLTRDHPSDWPLDQRGRISEEALASKLPSNPDVIFVCGKDDFVTHVAGPEVVRNKPSLLKISPVAEYGGILKKIGLPETCKVFIL